MYNYPHYKEQDREKIIGFMKDHPFITLIGADKNGRIEATQIPVLVEEKEGKLFIYGHVAKSRTITGPLKKIQMFLPYLPVRIPMSAALGIVAILSRPLPGIIFQSMPGGK